MLIMMIMIMKTLYSDEGFQLKMSVIRSTISTGCHHFYISYSLLTLSTQHHISK